MRVTECQCKVGAKPKATDPTFSIFSLIDTIVRYVYRKIRYKTYREILCIIIHIILLGGTAAITGSVPLAGASWRAAAWAAAALAWGENLAQAICSS